MAPVLLNYPTTGPSSARAGARSMGPTFGNMAAWPAGCPNEWMNLMRASHKGPDGPGGRVSHARRPWSRKLASRRLAKRADNCWSLSSSMASATATTAALILSPCDSRGDKVVLGGGGPEGPVRVPIYFVYAAKRGCELDLCVQLSKNTSHPTTRLRSARFKNYGSRPSSAPWRGPAERKLLRSSSRRRDERAVRSWCEFANR